MVKRSQQEVSGSSRHWYQDKYQHVLVQRNVLALLALGALLAAVACSIWAMSLTPLKSVEPYLLQIDDKTGITQKVNPVSRSDYSANEAIDRYFASTYLRMRESYNINILRYDYNVVRLMSSPNVFYAFRHQVDPSNPLSIATKLGTNGQRDVKINSLNYISNPAPRGRKSDEPVPKIIQARITTTDSIPNQADIEQQWVVTITFEYANLNLDEEEQLLNPLGYQVTSYQIQREIN